jgi:hypothetical protein
MGLMSISTTRAEREKTREKTFFFASPFHIGHKFLGSSTGSRQNEGTTAQRILTPVPFNSQRDRYINDTCNEFLSRKSNYISITINPSPSPPATPATPDPNPARRIVSERPDTPIPQTIWGFSIFLQKPAPSPSQSSQRL